MALFTISNHTENIAALFERPKLLCLNQSLIAGNVSCHVNVYKAHPTCCATVPTENKQAKKSKLPSGTPWARKHCDVYPDLSHVSDTSVFLATRPLSHPSVSKG